MEADKVVATQTLGQCEMFSELNEVDLRKVANLAEEKEYAAGTIIFQQNTPADELLVLRAGKVALQRSLSGIAAQPARQTTIAIAGANEVIGWSALVRPHIYTLTAICLQPTNVLSIGGIKLRSLLGANHHIGYHILDGLTTVIACRLDDTWQVLISERLSTLGTRTADMG